MLTGFQVSTDGLIKYRARVEATRGGREIVGLEILYCVKA